jgi:hypothetical protein
VRKVLHKIWTAPFGLGDGGELVADARVVRKKCPAARLRAFGRTKYAASEQTASTMSEA